MGVDLEAVKASQGEGALYLGDVDVSIIDIQQVLIDALNAHLNLGRSQAANQGEGGGRHGVWAGLDNQPNNAVTCGFVGLLLAFQVFKGGGLPGGDGLPSAAFAVEGADGLVVGARMSAVGLGDGVLQAFDTGFELSFIGWDACLAVLLAAGCDLGRQGRRRYGSKGCGSVVALGCIAVKHGVCLSCGHGMVVEGAKELAYKPDLVGPGIVAPCAAQHNELDLVGGVAHLRECRQARAYLQIGVKAVLLGAGTGWLGVQVALGHSQVVGTKQAVARARPRLGDNRNGRHARGRASRLDAQDGQ